MESRSIQRTTLWAATEPERQASETLSRPAIQIDLEGIALSEQALLRDVEYVIVLYEEVIGSAASRTRQMIERDGAINALSKLAVRPDLQKGFKVLRDSGQLDHSFEALIVKYQCLFSKDVVEAARWRLENADNLCCL